MPQPIKELKADKDYWEELEKLLPAWRLFGWSFRRTASFTTPGHWGNTSTDILQITGRQRDDLVKALKGEIK